VLLCAVPIADRGYRLPRLDVTAIRWRAMRLTPEVPNYESKHEYDRDREDELYQHRSCLEVSSNGVESAAQIGANRAHDGDFHRPRSPIAFAQSAREEFGLPGQCGQRLGASSWLTAQRSG